MDAARVRRGVVILDRDGTLNVERHYLSDPAQVELVDGVADGLRHLRELGVELLVITNQSGVGRGYFTERTLDAIHRRLGECLSEAGVHLSAIYVCPHVPADGCRCRKPRYRPPLERAAWERGFLSSRRLRDRRKGIRPGDGTTDGQHDPPGPDRVWHRGGCRRQRQRRLRRGRPAGGGPRDREALAERAGLVRSRATARAMGGGNSRCFRSARIRRRAVRSSDLTAAACAEGIASARRRHRRGLPGGRQADALRQRR